MKEEWKRVPIEEREYEVSNHGRIRSQKGIIKGSNISGYNTLNLRIGGRSLTFYVYKLVAQLFMDPPKEGDRYLMFIDRDKLNSRSDNLKWAKSAKEFQYPRKNSPKQCKNAKITITDAEMIRSMLETGVKKMHLAKRYDISHTQINRIQSGKCWKVV